MLADREISLVIESTADGLHVYDDPAQVLTNNPPFPMQLFQLNNYARLSPDGPEFRFAKGIPFQEYSRGMGGMGLPGDLSSQSRFVRAAFACLNAQSGEDELSSVSQFFHILGAVEQQRGLCRLPDGQYEITLYSACMNASRGLYYYRTYDNPQWTVVDLHREELDESQLVSYPLREKTEIFRQNG